jgi:Fe2+ transport system protein FeoA
MTCALCGFEYEPGGTACASSGCPLAFGACRFEHCPRCGYTVPSVESGAFGWLLRKLGGTKAPSTPAAAPTSARRRLTDLAAGTDAVVAEIAGPDELAGHLTLLGLTPGSRVRLCQRRPSYVVQVEGTEVAFERTVAETIWVQ